MWFNVPAGIAGLGMIVFGVHLGIEGSILAAIVCVVIGVGVLQWVRENAPTYQQRVGQLQKELQQEQEKTGALRKKLKE